MVEQQAKGIIIGMGSTEKMCVGNDKAFDKTNVRMIIKHQHSLEEMRLKVLDMSLQHKLKWSHTQSTNGFTSLIKCKIKSRLVTTPW